MESVLKTFKIIVHENLASLIINCRRRDRILAAYASQKFTMKKNNKKKNNNFYIARDISKDVSSSTERSLMNHSIIQFKAFLISMSMAECIKQKLIVYLDSGGTQTEIECRRYVESYHPKLKAKLGVSCNDLSNLKYIERNVEILLREDIMETHNPFTCNYTNLPPSSLDGGKSRHDNHHHLQYRCIINYDKGFFIQSKLYYDRKESFIDEINSFEMLHYSRESPIFDDSHYFIIDLTENTILGLASFLDCNNISVKTMYLNDNEGTTLYQRIVIDDYKNQQPFILEHEFSPASSSSSSSSTKSSWQRYFDISCSLSAKLPLNLVNNGYTNVSSLPIHINDNKMDEYNKYDYIFFKLDGALATLKFYDHHFVLTDNVRKSDSFPHSLPKNISHRLKDFSFIVESDLYESYFSTPNKPKPMAIIDLHTSAFSAVERMNIIQKLKIFASKPLREYFIFFQGEKIKSDNASSDIFYPNKSLSYLNSKLIQYLKKHFIFFIKKNTNITPSQNKFELYHGKIYEVYIDKNYNIKEILKPRHDKIYPNSRKCIEYIINTNLQNDMMS